MFWVNIVFVRNKCFVAFRTSGEQKMSLIFFEPVNWRLPNRKFQVEVDYGILKLVLSLLPLNFLQIIFKSFFFSFWITSIHVMWSEISFLCIALAVFSSAYCACCLESILVWNSVEKTRTRVKEQKFFLWFFVAESCLISDCLV